MPIPLKQKIFFAAWMAILSIFLPGVLSAGIESILERSVTKGLFLIADPRLTDPNFRESVVLITHHGADGSLGVIINRPTDRPLSSLPGLPLQGTSSGFLFIGGPVSRNALSSLVQTEHASKEVEAVLEGVYFMTDPLATAGLLKESKQFRIYAGYAGWAPGQLQGEIDRGDWRLLPADAALLFRNNPETVWPELFRRSQQRSVKRPGPLLSAVDGFRNHS